MSISSHIKLAKLPGYAEVILRYGGVSLHPLFVNVEPSLKLQVLNRIALNRRAGFCFFRIPKAANSTIVMSLLTNMALNSKVELSSIQAKRALKGIPRMSEMDRLYVFTFVRHPASRALSAFMNKSRCEELRRRHACLAGEPGTIQGFHLNGQRVICLDIPDDYEFMDPTLVRLLENRVGPFLQ